MDDIMIKMTRFEEHLKNQDEKLGDIKKQLGDFICACDNKYSSKWVEQVIRWAMIVIGTAAIGFVGVVIMSQIIFK